MTRHWIQTVGIMALTGMLIATACSRRQTPETEPRDRSQPPPVTTTEPAEDPNAAAEAERRRFDRAMEDLRGPIYFDFDRSDLRPEAREELRRKAEVLRSFPEVRVRIEGHADERGTVEYNLALGERRADAARRFLIDLGIDPDRITTVSYGEERPAVEGQNEAAWSRNRRDEFVPLGI